MTHSDLASTLRRTLPRQATLRAFILPTMLAMSAYLIPPQAWAAAPTTTTLSRNRRDHPSNVRRRQATWSL